MGKRRNQQRSQKSGWFAPTPRFLDRLEILTGKWCFSTWKCMKAKLISRRYLPGSVPSGLPGPKSQQLVPITPSSPIVAGWWHWSGSPCLLPFMSVHSTGGAKREAAFLTKALWAGKGFQLPKPRSQAVPTAHLAPCFSHSPASNYSPSLYWGLRGAARQPHCHSSAWKIHFYLPFSEKTYTKWPGRTWLLRGRAGW